MTGKQAETVQKCEYRYTVAGQDRQLATIQREGHQDWLPVKLFELASTRVLIELDDPLPTDEVLLIRLALEDGDVDEEFTATVEWSQMSVRSDWWVSCELGEAISDRLIDRLAHQRFVERRQDPRFPIDMDARLKFELTDDWTVVRLSNYSAGGFQASLPKVRIATGQRVLLRVEGPNQEPIELAARIVWISDREDGMSIGCAFLQRHAYSRFRRAVGIMPASAAAAVSLRDGVVPWWYRTWRALCSMFGSRSSK